MYIEYDRILIIIIVAIHTHTFNVFYICTFIICA